MKESFDIDYDNKQITFNDARFYLNKAGEFIPSVTTILDAYPKSAYLMNWIRNQGAEGESYRDERGLVGDAVHRLTEEYDKGNLLDVRDVIKTEPKFTAEIWSMVDKYVEFRNAYPELEVAVNEQQIIDERWAGTIDRIYYYKPSKTFWLVDIKTSSAVHKKDWLQVAAYAHSRRKLYKNNISKIAILHLRAKTRTIQRSKFQGIGWRLESQPNPESELFDLWLKVVDLWNIENKHLKPKQLTYQLTYQHGTNQ